MAKIKITIATHSSTDSHGFSLTGAGCDKYFETLLLIENNIVQIYDNNVYFPVI